MVDLPPGRVNPESVPAKSFKQRDLFRAWRGFGKGAFARLYGERAGECGWHKKSAWCLRSVSSRDSNATLLPSSSFPSTSGVKVADFLRIGFPNKIFPKTFRQLVLMVGQPKC